MPPAKATVSGIAKRDIRVFTECRKIFAEGAPSHIAAQKLAASWINPERFHRELSTTESQ